VRRVLAVLIYHGLRLVACVLLHLGFGLRISGRQHLPQFGSFVLASNHVSYLDPVVLGVACPRRLVFVARADVFEWQVVGPFMRLLQTIPVQPSEAPRLGSGPSPERQSKGEADVSLREAVRLLRLGQPVAIFPEGGRQFSGQLGTAKPGVGWLAASARVPIVPVLLDGTFEAMPPHGPQRIHLGKQIRVAFGPQIRYAGGPLSDEAYQMLAKQVTLSWQGLASTVRNRR